MGRLSALLASCSVPIELYRSNPMNDKNRYVMYGANPASAISTTPARGSAMFDRSPSIGADT